ncbi:MAG: WYL domain-containing protein [Protaetiibacter sp.]
MRADRLVAALLLMQARGTVTAGELAAELEVSLATARRDLEALSAAGIPVYPQRGRGGGWQLLGGARTDLSGLGFGEMQALFTLVGPETAASPELAAAVRKLVRALPETFRAPAAAASTAVVVDRGRWGRAAPPPPALRDGLRDAVVARRRVRFGYRDREVEAAPWGLVDKAGTWYLLAEAHGAERTFRLDRMQGLEILDAGFAPPDGLDLDAAWRRIRERLERRRNAVTATALAPAAVVEPLRQVLGARHVRELGPAPDGRVRLEVGANTVEMLARQLAGWEPEVEVEGPEEVRAELAARGRALAGRYGTATPTAGSAAPAAR